MITICYNIVIENEMFLLRFDDAQPKPMEIITMTGKSRLLQLFLAVLLSAAPLLAADDFYVVAGGGGVGVKITGSPPIHITEPGFYYLAKNLDGRLYIESSHVTLDLMGFTVSGTGAGSGTGITISGVRENVEIRNGTVKNFVDGIGAYFEDPPERCHRVTNIRLIGNTQKGIYFAGSNHIIKGCTAYNNDVGIRCSNSLLIHNLSTGNISANISGAGNTLVDNRF